MLGTGRNKENKIEEIEVIKEYKYLGVVID